MGSVVSIRCLIIDFDDRSEGTSESAGGSDCKALNDSLGPEVLALLVGGRRTELSGHEVIAPSVVGGLFVSYLH